VLALCWVRVGCMLTEGDGPALARDHECPATGADGASVVPVTGPVTGPAWRVVAVEMDVPVSTRRVRSRLIPERNLRSRPPFWVRLRA
jgi:hypothetical protein